MTSEPKAPAPEVWERVARMAELGVLTASLLHELRQPLFAIKAIAELTGAGHTETADAMRALLTQVVHMEELLGHYGGLGRGDEADGVFDLREPLRLASEMYVRRAKQAGVELATDAGAAPLWVRGRETAVRQMAINLLQNALDAVEGRPRRRVELQVGRVGAHAWFEVRDTGVGVSEDVRARLFEPFVTSKPAGRGTGLGLHITRVLAEAAGGRVDLATEVGLGTRVRISLPLAQVDEGRGA